MTSKPKYKYFIYKARKRFGSKLIRIEVTEKQDIYLTFRVMHEVPINKTVYEGVFKWEIVSYTPLFYKNFRFFIPNVAIQHAKFDKIFNYLENEIKK